MIHISKSKRNGQFFVTTKSSINGKKLASTETLKSKASAWRNIKGQMKVWEADHVLVQDNTAAKPIVYKVFSTGLRLPTGNSIEKMP